MTADRTQPTEELFPVAEEVEPRRRRAWPWIVAFAIVAAIAVGAWFAGDALARQLVTGVVRDQVKSQLALPADQQVDVDIAGAVIPQLISGRFDELTVSSDDVQVSQLTGDVTVVAHDVPLSADGIFGGARATVELDPEQVRTLLSRVENFPAETVDLAAPDVTMTTELQLLGVGVPVGVTLSPSVAEGDVVLTPASLQVSGADVTADALRRQFGIVAEAVLRDWTVCIAQYIPAGITLTGVEVVGADGADELVATFEVQGTILSDPALRANGTCA